MENVNQQLEIIELLMLIGAFILLAINFALWGLHLKMHNTLEKSLLDNQAYLTVWITKINEELGLDAKGIEDELNGKYKG